AALAPDGHTVLLGDAAIEEMWDLKSGKRVAARLPKGRERYGPVAVSDDRRLLLLVETRKERAKEDGLGGGYGALAPAQHLVLWDTQTGKARVLARDEKMVVGLAIAPDGKRAVSSSYGTGTVVR